ncbi:MAG: hypothetical protein Q8J89_07970 [Caulobacter sp.]|nr:hypothetical protein [Caulobacter sp.]
MTVGKALAAMAIVGVLGGLVTAFGLLRSGEPRCTFETDAQAVAYIRRVFAEKPAAARTSPVWRGSDPRQLEVLRVSRDPSAVVIDFGRAGQTVLTAFVHDDCDVEWSHAARSTN